MSTGPEGYYPNPNRNEPPLFGVTPEGDVVVPDDLPDLVNLPEEPSLHPDTEVQDPNGIPVEDPPEWDENPDVQPTFVEKPEPVVEKSFDPEDPATWSWALRHYHKLIMDKIEEGISKGWRRLHIKGKERPLYIADLPLTEDEKAFLLRVSTEKWVSHLAVLNSGVDVRQLQANDNPELE